jgi:hypothetical protein
LESPAVTNTEPSSDATALPETPAVSAVPPSTDGLAPIVGSAGISVGLHLLLILLFGAATWAVKAASDSASEEYHAQIVADTSSDQQIGGFQFPGKAGLDVPDSARAAGTPEAPPRLSDFLKDHQPIDVRPASASDSGLDQLRGGELSRSDIVGVGGPSAAGQGGAGSGLGDRDVAGGGPVGSLWGVGEGQLARSVLYVMDRSGSMTDTFSLLQRELMRAIGSLNRDQLFNVLWFNEGKATELFTRLKAATMDNKREAFDAIKSIVPSGQTQPLDAVRRGLSYKPDVLFLLSDGDFGEDNQRIIQTIKQMNQGRKTRINTILFVYDTMGDGERVLRDIAETNHGSYKHVTEEDIRR